MTQPDAVLESKNEEYSAIAYYDTEARARAAVSALHAAGFAVSLLSVADEDLHWERVGVPILRWGDRMRFWGIRGALWGALLGVLLESAFFVLPSTGPLAAMGPFVGWIFAAAQGAAVGGAAGGLAASLPELETPRQALLARTAGVGPFLVFARGSSTMREDARTFLGSTAPEELTAPTDRR